MDMNLKEYKAQPDEGLYEKIEKRLRMRRMVRIGVGVASVCVVAVAVVFLSVGGTQKEEEQVIVAKTLENPVKQQVAYQEVPQKKPDVEAVSVGEAVPDCSVRPVEEAEMVVAPRPDEDGHSRSSIDAVAQQIVSVVAPKIDVVVAVQKPVVQQEEPAASKMDDAQEAVPTAIKEGEPPVVPVHFDNLIWAPTIIVPNGDVDENRTFGFKFSSNVTEFHVYIYNRGGRRVFMSTDPSFKWDGTHNGTALPQGAYVWVAKYRDTEGRLCQEKGTVTLVR